MLLRTVSFLAAGALLLAAPAPPGWAAPLKIDAKLAERGRVVYVRECAVCHGFKGLGDGTAAYLLFPAPRDFTSKLFKIRSTAPGEAPQRTDIARTITLGLPGSAMPSFESLGEADIRALSEYVLSLAGFENAPEEFVKVPKAPPATPEWLAKGKANYLKYECNKCHGDKGDGRGPSAAELKDYLKRPIFPNDYTRGVFKGGGDVQSIITRIMTGVEGTPMPSHAEVLEKEEDVIAMAHYVRQFSGGRSFRQPGTGAVPVRRAEGQAPARAADPRWAKVRPTRVPMMQLFSDGRPPVEVDVRALHDGKRIALLLEWADASADRRVRSVDTFADAAAVQFTLGQKQPPLFTMGSAQELVNIWFWSAAAQARGGDVEASYPGMAVDDYPFAGKTYPRKTMGHAPVVASRDTQAPFISAWAAGNPGSTPGIARGFMDMSAAGFGTIQPQAARDQNVGGEAGWSQGKWRVLFTRGMTSAGPEDAQFQPGATHPVGFAVWDGARRDRNGQKSVTTWYKLRIE